MSRSITLDREAVSAFCRRHRIRKLSLFGSVLHGDSRPDSDVDLLVEFCADARVGLFKMAALERELTGIVGRKVDLRTAADLSQYFRQAVLEEAEVQYAEAG
jgi:predicted nucleotidyltransferase